MTFDANGDPIGDSEFVVRTNRPWTLDIPEGAEWVRASATEGEGDATVEIYMFASNEGQSATLTFSLKNSVGKVFLSQEVTVTQGEAPEAGPVGKLVEFIEANHASASYKENYALGYSETTIEAVILANNEYGNNNSKLYVGDNTKQPKSAIVIWGSAYNTAANYPVGKKVTLDLSNAIYNNYYDLRELKDVVVTVSDEDPVEVVVPSISVAQFNTGNYQGQYVQVNNVKAPSSSVGKPWNESSSSYTTVTLTSTAASGGDLVTYISSSNYAPDIASQIIGDNTGAVRGTAEVFYATGQLVPVKPSDVAELCSNDPVLSASPETVTLNASEGATASIAITSNGSWTVSKASGSGFEFSPESGSGNGTVTVTASAANTAADVVTLGTLTIADGTNEVTVTVKQDIASTDEAIETTIADLVAKIELQQSAAVLDADNDYVFEGVLMNNLEVKNYAANTFYVAAEGATAAKNGLVLYGSEVGTATTGFAQGTRIKVTLKAGKAKIQNRYGVFQITGSTDSSWCEIESLGSTATIEPVTITADKIADYQGMYVSIEGTTSETGVWYNGSSTTTTLSTANGDLKVFVNKIAGETFNLNYAATTAAVKGIAMVYGSSSAQTPELLPQSAADVAAFNVSSTDPAITGVDPASLTWSATETDAKTIRVTGVELAGNLSAQLSGADAAQWGAPEVSSDGSTVTIAPAGANESEADYTATLTLTVGSTSKTVTLTQSKAAASTGGGKWVKVTSAPSDWSGDYLIVYENADGNLIFDGSLTKLDAVSNTVKVEIADGAIASSAEIEACKFTVAAIEGGYSIKSASGYYIYQTSDANGLTSNTSTTGLNTLELNDDGSVQVTSSSAVLRYNSTSGQTRFRYYKSSTYTAQKAIALYKYTE